MVNFARIIGDIVGGVGKVFRKRKPDIVIDLSPTKSGTTRTTSGGIVSTPGSKALPGYSSTPSTSSGSSRRRSSGGGGSSSSSRRRAEEEAARREVEARIRADEEKKRKEEERKAKAQAKAEAEKLAGQKQFRELKFKEETKKKEIERQLLDAKERESRAAQLEMSRIDDAKKRVRGQGGRTQTRTLKDSKTGAEIIQTITVVDRLVDGRRIQERIFESKNLRTGETTIKTFSRDKRGRMIQSGGIKYTGLSKQGLIDLNKSLTGGDILLFDAKTFTPTGIRSKMFNKTFPYTKEGLSDYATKIQDALNTQQKYFEVRPGFKRTLQGFLDKGLAKLDTGLQAKVNPLNLGLVGKITKETDLTLGDVVKPVTGLLAYGKKQIDWAVSESERGWEEILFAPELSLGLKRTPTLSYIPKVIAGVGRIASYAIPGVGLGILAVDLGGSGHNLLFPGIEVQNLTSSLYSQYKSGTILGANQRHLTKNEFVKINEKEIIRVIRQAALIEIVGTAAFMIGGKLVLAGLKGIGRMSSKQLGKLGAFLKKQPGIKTGILKLGKLRKADFKYNVRKNKIEYKGRVISAKGFKRGDQIKSLSKRIAKELQKTEGKLNQFDELRLIKRIESLIRSKLGKITPVSQLNIPGVKTNTKIRNFLKNLLKKKVKPKTEPISAKRFERDIKIKELSKRISKELQAREGQLNQFDTLKLQKRIELVIRNKLGKTAPISKINIPSIKTNTKIKNFFKGILKRKVKPKTKPISLRQIRREEGIKALSRRFSKEMQKRTGKKLNQFDELRLRKKLETMIRDRLGRDKNLITIKLKDVVPKIGKIKKVTTKSLNLENQRRRVIKKFIKQFEISRGVKLSNKRKRLLENNLLRKVRDGKIKLKEFSINIKKLKARPKIIDLPRLKVIKAIKRKVPFERPPFREVSGGRQRLLMETKVVKQRVKSKIIQLEKQIPKTKSKIKIISLRKQLTRQKQMQKSLFKTKLKQVSVLVQRTRIKGKVRFAPQISPQASLTKSLRKQITSNLQKSESKIASILKSKAKATSISGLISLKAQKTKMKSRLKSKLKQKQKTKTKTRLFIPRKKKGVQYRRLSKPVMTYLIKIKRQGKFKTVLKDLTLNDAKDFMAYNLDNSLARTGKVLKSGLRKKIVVRLPNKMMGEFGRVRRKFRTFKLRKGKKIPLSGTKFIERKKFVGDKPLERLELQKFRLRKSMKKKRSRLSALIKKKSKRKPVKKRRVTKKKPIKRRVTKRKRKR